MIWNLVLIALFISLAIYLVLIIYSGSFWLNSMNKSVSYFNYFAHQSKKTPQKSFLIILGRFIEEHLPNNLTQKLRLDIKLLNRKENDLIQSYGLIGLSIIILIACYIISKNLVFISLFIVITISVIAEIKISVEIHKSKIENNLDHIVKCLKILVAKAETPIITALEVINQDLHQDLYGLKQELHKIIERAKKSGIRKTLHEFDSQSSTFQDFIALLLSIHEGASKKAISSSINTFLEKYEEDKNEQIRAESDNLQLYLILPVIIMLILAMLPMIDAINFYMKNTGVL